MGKKIGGAFAALVMLCAPAFAQEFVTGAERDKVIADTKEVCTDAVRREYGLKIDDAAIENYCQCALVEMTATITKAEADERVKALATKEKMKAARQKCLPLLEAGMSAEDMLGGEERQRFVDFQRRTCVEHYKQLPTSAPLAERYPVYCGCMAEEMADRVTRAEALSGPGILPGLKARTDAASAACFAVMDAGLGTVAEYRKVWIAGMRQACLDGKPFPDNLSHATALCDCVSAEIGQAVTSEMIAKRIRTLELPALTEIAKKCIRKIVK